MRVIPKALQHQTRLTFRSHAIDFTQTRRNQMRILKNLTKFVAILAIAVTFINCRGKEEKPEETTPTENASPTPTESPAVDSTAMSFDAAGSDSGKIDGLKTVFFELITLLVESKDTVADSISVDLWILLIKWILKYAHNSIFHAIFFRLIYSVLR